ncbi:MAG: hypothetical protein VXW65_02155 [Pseudomonadota bacterium]|nr:hypothetical protein [Pseudomonadota bacterium]
MYMKLRIWAMCGISLALVACGGGSDQAPSASSTGSPSSDQPSTKPLPVVDVLPKILKDDAVRMQPIANTSPYFKQNSSAQFEQEFLQGVYRYGQVFVRDINAECNGFFSKGTCPYFQRLSRDDAGVLRQESYAYLPVSKQWIQIELFEDNSLKGFFEYTFNVKVAEGARQPSADYIAALDTAKLSVEGQGSYLSVKDLTLQLKVNRESISGQVIESASSQLFSQQAVSYTAGFEFQQPVSVSYFHPDDMGGREECQDDSQIPYKTAEEFIYKYQSPKSICLLFEHLGAFSFNPLARELSIGGRKTSFALTTEEGSRELTFRPTYFDQSSSTSEQQYVYALIFNPNFFLGKSIYYSKGYVLPLKDYKNFAAFQDWLGTQSADPDIFDIPK